jgi:hypothetical protein
MNNIQKKTKIEKKKKSNDLAYASLFIKHHQNVEAEINSLFRRLVRVPTIIEDVPLIFAIVRFLDCLFEPCPRGSARPDRSFFFKSTFKLWSIYSTIWALV